MSGPCAAVQVQFGWGHKAGGVMCVKGHAIMCCDLPSLARMLLLSDLAADQGAGAQLRSPKGAAYGIVKSTCCLSLRAMLTGHVDPLHGLMESLSHSHNCMQCHA